MTELFPNKFKEIPYAVQFFDELYITYITILMMKNREKDALTFLEMAQKICE